MARARCEGLVLWSLLTVPLTVSLTPLLVRDKGNGKGTRSTHPEGFKNCLGTAQWTPQVKTLLTHDLPVSPASPFQSQFQLISDTELAWGTQLWRRWRSGGLVTCRAQCPDTRVVGEDTRDGSTPSNFMILCEPSSPLLLSVTLELEWGD